jgi:HSP20 family protein
MKGGIYMKLINRNKKHNNRNHRREEVQNNSDVPAMFDDFFMRDIFLPSFSNTGVSTPAVNIIETSNDFRLEMVAPGMKKENFSLELQNDQLTISYEHEDNREGERSDWKYLTHEYNYHSFTRSFSLPDTIDSEKIQAKYEDGILHIAIPKREEAKRKSMRIQVS